MELIEKIVRRILKEQSFVAQVKSVDQDNDLCTVVVEETELEIDDVRLKAIEDATTTKVVAYPKVDSRVVCSIIHNDENQVVISKMSEVEKIVVDCENVVINGGNNGGLTNTPELKEQLDKTKAVVEAIDSTLKNWTVTPGDGGAALKAAYGVASSGKSTGDYSNIEDTKVKH